MKPFFLTILLITCLSTQAFAKDVTVELPVSTRIINLATMPVEEALAFCNERSMACPAIREKYDIKYGKQDVFSENESKKFKEDAKQALKERTANVLTTSARNRMFE